jgi:hypothetical protein
MNNVIQQVAEAKCPDKYCDDGLLADVFGLHFKCYGTGLRWPTLLRKIVGTRPNGLLPD